MTDGPCICGNCPDCRQYMTELGEIYRVLEATYNAHRTDILSQADGLRGPVCLSCGVTLVFEYGDEDGKPLYNPLLRHKFEQQSLAIKQLFDIRRSWDGI